MTKTGPLAAASIAGLLLYVAMAPAHAQDAAPRAAEATRQASPSPHSYRLDYALTELEDGKKIDSRQYSLSLGGGTQGTQPWQGEVQIGTRIPVVMKSDGSIQYVNAGTKIVGFISTREGTQLLRTNCDVSSVAPDEANVDGRPILRTLTIVNEAPIALGKAVLVGTADDSNSKRKFELEVTVTEIN